MKRLVLLLFILLPLGLNGCSAGSKNQRQQEDSDEWEGSWSTDDGAQGKADKRYIAKLSDNPKPVPGAEGEPGAPAQSSPPHPKKSSKKVLNDDWGIDLVVVDTSDQEPRAVAKKKKPVAKVKKKAKKNKKNKKKHKKKRKRRKLRKKPRPEPKAKPDPGPAPAPLVDPKPDPAPPLEDLPGNGLAEDWEEEPSPIHSPRPATRSRPIPSPTPRPNPQPAPISALKAAPKTAQNPAPQPASQPVPGESASEKDQAEVLIDLQGGISMERGNRFFPEAGLGLGWNLGKHLGWPGLYLRADVDTFFGKSPLGTEYVFLDPGFGFQGRFALGPVNISVLLEFCLRTTFITKRSSSTSDPSGMGMGASGSLMLDVPIYEFLSLQVGADGRYMKDPLSGNFEVSAVFFGGLGFAF